MKFSIFRPGTCTLWSEKLHIEGYNAINISLALNYFLNILIMQDCRPWPVPIFLSYSETIHTTTITAIWLLSNHSANPLFGSYHHAQHDDSRYSHYSRHWHKNPSPRSSFQCHLRLTRLFHRFWCTLSEMACWLMTPANCYSTLC